MLAVGPNKLLVAVRAGDCQEMQRLIDEEGLTPSHVYPRGMTALHEACEATQVEAAKLLIENGAEVNKQVCSFLETKEDFIRCLLVVSVAGMILIGQASHVELVMKCTLYLNP